MAVSVAETEEFGGLPELRAWCVRSHEVRVVPTRR